MRFEYSPATPDDWPSSIVLSATGVEEDSGIEEGETRVYEPNWKHRVAGKTIREQRAEIEKLKAALGAAEERVLAAETLLRIAVNCNHEVAWNNGLCSGPECEYFAMEDDCSSCKLESTLAEMGIEFPMQSPHRLTSERIIALMKLGRDLRGHIDRARSPEDGDAEAGALFARCDALGIGGAR